MAAELFGSFRGSILTLIWLLFAARSNGLNCILWNFIHSIVSITSIIYNFIHYFLRLRRMAFKRSAVYFRLSAPSRSVDTQESTSTGLTGRAFGYCTLRYPFFISRLLPDRKFLVCGHSTYCRIDIRISSLPSYSVIKRSRCSIATAPSFIYLCCFAQRIWP